LVNMNGGIIERNTAGYWGGGVYMKNSGFTMEGGSIIRGNHAEYGGGMYLVRSGFTMEKGRIAYNTASGSDADSDGKGGGVAVNGKTGGARFTMNGGEISENTARYGGGAWIYANTDGETTGRADFILNDGCIRNNTAKKSGGGVYAYSSRKDGSTGEDAQAVFTMKGGDITGNEAKSSGGGIRSEVGRNVWTKIYLLGGIISSNSAKNGGGLCTLRNFSQIGNGATIRDNHASERGGGIYNDYGQLTISGGSIVNNDAAIDGGGVYTYLPHGNNLSISGNFAITGNIIKSSEETISNNLVLADNGKTTDDKFKINILGKLDESTKLGIRTLFTETRKSKTAVVTKGLKGNGTLSNFIAEGDGTISINAAGELEYIAPCAHDGGFDIIGARDPNCTQKGSTGEKHCKKCGALIEPAKEIPVDPDKHDYDEGVVTKPATRFETGETTHTCRNCGNKKTLANIPSTEKDETAEDKQERDEDTRDANGNTLIESETVKDEKTGEETETVIIKDKPVSKIVTDPVSGKETVESIIWIGGLSGNYAYTGSSVKPSFRVYDGMKKLVENTDYTVSYSANKDAGTAEITVKFKGNYKGTESVKTSFTIDPADLGTDVRAHDLGVVKKSGAQKPVPVVTFISTGKTINKKNFDISYDREVKDAGVYTATITPKNGNFTGSTTALITVTDKNHLLENAKVTFDPASYAYTGKEIVPDPAKIKVKIGSNTLVIGRDVRIASIHNNILPGNASVIFEAISSNQAGCVGSKTASFKIKGSRVIKDEAPFAITVEKSVAFAKGGAKAAVKVMDGTTELKNGKDYTLKYKKNKSVTTGETAEVIIKGKGNYKGSVTRKFAVTKQNLNALKENISVEDQFKPKSKLKKPVVTIVDTDGKELEADRDYTVGKPDADRNPANTEISGNAVVKITGKGAYEGEVEVTFSYNKESSEVKGYVNNIKKGTAKVIFKGQGSFAGKKTVSFKIKQKKVNFEGSLVGGEWK
ncbi:MAG: hypothetical protein K6F86_12455, partial [Lachnospiraceae bacterium]|nr:hypothetical protein [Lachnospiraceae bacterium]